jgi:hypothetical protein
MKKSNFILGLILLIGYYSCEKVDDTSDNLDSFLISYQIGSSWTNYSYDATIDQNGKLYINEQIGMTSQSRESEFDIPSEDVILIKEKLNNLTSIKLLDKYGFGNDAPTDLPTNKIKYTTGSKSDSTYLYFPTDNELPDELDSFLQIVKQVLLENDTIKNQ